MSKDLRIPITMEIPPEVSSAVEDRVSEDVAYVVAREKAIEKTYNNLKRRTSIRKLGEYLLNNWNKGEFIISDLCRATGSKENVVKMHIADLNFWRQFPLKLIPVPKKAGHLQSVLKDINTTEKYLRRKSRTIASMEQVYENMDSQVRVKKEEYAHKTSSKVKVEEKEREKEQEEDNLD